MRISFIIIHALVALMFTPLLQAQSSKEPQETTIEFSTCSWERMKDEIYYISKGGKENPTYSKIDLSVMSRSLPCKAKTDGGVSFFRKAGLSDEGEQLYALVAIGKTPANCRRVTFIFFKTKTGKIYIRTIADDRKNSPFGAYQFYNMTKLTIRGAVAEKKFSIKPGSTKTISLSKKQGTEFTYAAFAKINGKNRWLARNTWRFNPDRHLKVFMVAYKDKQGRVQLSSKGLVEFKSAPQN